MGRTREGSSHARGGSARHSRMRLWTGRDRQGSDGRRRWRGGRPRRDDAGSSAGVGKEGRPRRRPRARPPVRARRSRRRAVRDASARTSGAGNGGGQVGGAVGVDRRRPRARRHRAGPRITPARHASAATSRNPRVTSSINAVRRRPRGQARPPPAVQIRFDRGPSGAGRSATNRRPARPRHLRCGRPRAIVRPAIIADGKARG